MFLRIYLVAYFLILAAAGFALWQAGVLERLPLGWAVLSLLVAIGLGALLGLVSHRRV